MYQKLATNGIAVERLVKSAYGIDTSYYEGIRHERSLNGRLQIGFIGTLAPHKGCHVLIDAVASLPPDSYHLRIYGSPKDFPDYYAQLRDAAGANPNIEFCGTFPNSEIGRVFSAIDVLVIPSVWYENTPLVLYSAMASGCPAIVSDYPGMTETVTHDQNGMAFPSGDAQALRERLARLIDEPALLARLSGNCQPPKSIVRYVDELTDFYDTALRQPQTRELPAGSQDIPAALPAKLLSISGWALPVGGELEAVLLVDTDGVLGRADRFGDRIDVVEAYRAQNVKCKYSRIGFSIAFDRQPSEQAFIRIVTRDGNSADLMMTSVREGQACMVESSIYLGIDRMSLSKLTS
jgi:hypothetical protein